MVIQIKKQILKVKMKKIQVPIKIEFITLLAWIGLRWIEEFGLKLGPTNRANRVLRQPSIGAL